MRRSSRARKRSKIFFATLPIFFQSSSASSQTNRPLVDEFDHRLGKIRRALRAFREVLADEGFDALLAQVLPDHLELALGVAAETVRRDDDGQAVVLKEHQGVAC
jgi:hypothetical protein